MKRIYFIITFIISILFSNVVYSQTSNTSSTGDSYQRNGNEFSSMSKTNNSTTTELTNYTYKDSKGIVYPIYISTNGSCFIIKTSAKTGKDYKQYMKVEISQQICKELNRKYKSKTNK